MNHRFYGQFPAILIVILLVVSCGPSPLSITPTTLPPTALLPTTAPTVQATATLQPTVAPSPTSPPPTATQQPPTATRAPSPTSVPPTPVPTDTPTLVPETPTAVPSVPKEPGGEHDWELTIEAMPSEPAASPTTAGGSTGGGPLDAVIPPGEGRELLFNNCTSCHSVVCSLIGQRTAGNWNTVRFGHSDRVTGLSEADQDILYAYLIENFGDQKPEPDLPPELKEQGCSAQ